MGKVVNININFFRELREVPNEEIVVRVQNIAEKLKIDFDEAAYKVIALFKKQAKLLGAKKSKTRQRVTKELPSIIEIPAECKPLFTTRRRLTQSSGKISIRHAEPRRPAHTEHGDIRIWHGSKRGRSHDEIRRPHRSKPPRPKRTSETKIQKIQQAYEDQAGVIFDYLRKVSRKEKVTGQDSINFLSAFSAIVWSKPINWFTFRSQGALDRVLPEIVWVSAGRDVVAKNILIDRFATDPEYRTEIIRNGWYVTVEYDGTVKGYLGDYIRKMYKAKIEGATREYQGTMVFKIKSALELAIGK